MFIIKCMIPFALLILTEQLASASQPNSSMFQSSSGETLLAQTSTEKAPTDNKKEAGENVSSIKSASEKAENDIKAPKIIYDLSKLPFATRKMRQLIYDAASSGNIENLRPYIGYGDDVTMLSLGGFDEDPIEFLKSISGDSEGQELLAIITEILDAGFILMDEGTDQEMYVWPYYFAHSLQTLTPEQKVQLFRLITFGDYQDMESFGAYIFYRLGITPQGRWRFFVAGD